MQGRKQTIAIGLAVALIATIAIFWAVDDGLGEPSVPGGDVATVKDAQDIPRGPETANNGINFDHALAQAAKQSQLKAVPQPGTPRYAAVRDQAMGDLLDVVWIEGEAKERGVQVTDSEIQSQLVQIKKQNFKKKGSFQKFLKQSGFTPADVLQRVRLQLLSQKIQEQIVKGVKPVSNKEAQKFYDANPSQFEQPESRDARVILNKDQAKVNQAKAILEKSSSPASFAKVAKKFSTDPVSKKSAGLRSNVTQGTSGDPALDKAMFSAPTNQLIGPVKTASGFYLIDVIKVTPKQKQPFKAVAQQLIQQLTQQKQQEAFSSFIEDYRTKWTSRTTCAKGFIMNRCDNYDQPAPRQPGAPIVNSTRPAAPGKLPGLGQSATAGAPQGPHPAGEDKASAGAGGGLQGLPPGVVPSGAGGGAGAGAGAGGAGAPPGATSPSPSP